MIGHLARRKLTVHRPVASDDGAGGQMVAFGQVAPVWVKVNQPSAEEARLAAQFGAELSHILHAAVGADVRRGDELDGELPTDVPAGRRLRVISTVGQERPDGTATYVRISCEVTQAE